MGKFKVIYVAMTLHVQILYTVTKAAKISKEKTLVKCKILRKSTVDFQNNFRFKNSSGLANWFSAKFLMNLIVC